MKEIKNQKKANKYNKKEEKIIQGKTSVNS